MHALPEVVNKLESYLHFSFVHGYIHFWIQLIVVFPGAC